MLYEIPLCNYEKFLKKVKTIQKKCEKYGNVFSFKDLGEVYKQVSKFMLLTETEKKLAEKENANLDLIPMKFHIVDIEGTAKIDGWEFVGTLYPNQDGNLIKKVINIDIPEHYYHDEIICEHCKKKIKRKYTYLVHRSDEFKQVGKTCLKDYTGIDAEVVASINSVIKVVEELEHDFSNYKKEKLFNVEKLLRITSKICRLQNGYTINSRYPTHVTAMNVYKMFEFKYDYPALLDLAENIDLGNEETHKIVEKAKTFIENSDNENLKIMLKCEDAPLTFMEEVAKVIYNFYESIDSDHEFFGNIGDTVEIDAEDFKYITSFNTAYGCSNLYSFKSGNHIFKYFSSKHFDNVKKCKIKCTIKHHNVYNNDKENIVARCKFL